jgi:hypothetical protein
MLQMEYLMKEPITAYSSFAFVLTVVVDLDAFFMVPTACEIADWPNPNP